MLKTYFQSLWSKCTPYYCILSLVILVFFGLLLYGFPDSAAPWFDEGINLSITKAWAEHGVYSMQEAPGMFVSERSLLITTNFPLLGFIALVFKLFGVGLAQAKVVMIGFLIIFAIVFFRFIKKNYGKDAALMGLALLVTFLPLYGNGKSALGEIPGLTYFLLGLLWFDKEKPWQIFLTGIWFGLAAVTKSIYVLFLASLAAGEIWYAIKNKKIGYHQWLWLVLGVLIPVLIWIYTLLPREMTSDFFQKTLQLYSNPYRAEHTLVINLKRFVTESTPLHLFLLLCTFVIAKAIHRFRSFSVYEVMIGVFIILNLIFYVKTVGWYRYFFPAHILAILLFPGALIEIIKFKKIPDWIRKFGVQFVVVVLCIIQGVQIILHIHDSVYFNSEPRRFAGEVDELVPEAADLLIVDDPTFAFLIQHSRTYQYVQTSPHLLVGEGLFADGKYPEYILAPEIEKIVYPDIQLTVSTRYDKISQGKNYILYHRHN